MSGCLRILVPAGVVLGVFIVALMTFINPGRFFTSCQATWARWSCPAPRSRWNRRGLPATPKISAVTKSPPRAAAQDMAKPDFVESTDLRAKLAMQDNNSAELVTVGGIYNTKTEILTLGPNILLPSTNGYEARLADAVVEVRKGNITSDKPVEVKMARGTLNAQPPRGDQFRRDHPLRWRLW
jgi:lipopolysaccharide export system protein LptC